MQPENEKNATVVVDETLLHFTKSDIFTPDNISKLMSSYLKKEGNLLEPAVGEGSLLKYLSLDSYTEIDLYDIKRHYLSKCPDGPNITKHCCDFLKLEQNNKKYKNIILNPPYIRIQDLPADYVAFIKSKWPQIMQGSIDIYYAFLLKCLELLDDDGVMVAITPNSYLFSKCATPFRQYLVENRLIAEIIDYESKKVFDDAAVYCCITVFTKTTKTKTKQSFLYNKKEIQYNGLSSESNLNTNKQCSLFHSSATPGRTLKDICKITNGIATLRDKIFIHPKKLFDEPCWREVTNSKTKQFVIFPYTDTAKIIEEKELKEKNPKTYQYLLENKAELATRDKGNKTYAAWYAFGRTQSLKISKQERVIYLPTFVDPEKIGFCVGAPQLYSSCLCIEPVNVEDIDLIIKTIRQNVDHIKKNSSKRNNGWINLSSRVLSDLNCDLYKEDE